MNCPTTNNTFGTIIKINIITFTELNMSVGDNYFTVRYQVRQTHFYIDVINVHRLTRLLSEELIMFFYLRFMPNKCSILTLI